MKQAGPFCVFLMLAFFLAGCSYNPFSRNNHTTGSPVGAAIGALAGGGTIAAMGGTKPMIAVGGITGGMLGYYLTTLRADAAEIINAGGQVYQLGDFIGIYVPTDKLFEPNTADLLPRAAPILDSVAMVLQRYPNQNIVVSGNTSGFYCARWEQNLSERRAQIVSAYLWKVGINNFKFQSTNMRKLNYVGYGDYFPVASHITNKGIRANSRIQIVSYPSGCDLNLRERNTNVYKFASIEDKNIKYSSPNRCDRDDQDCVDSL